ncbi:MAG: hypothetical protein IT235_08985 [Bacteroidia bacterium]|nr:hypothetical protein [Bacteroidia bacterium]
MGETAYSKLLINDSGNGILNATIEPESNLSPGVYYIVATSKNELFRKMLVVTGYK